MTPTEKIEEIEKEIEELKKPFIYIEKAQPITIEGIREICKEPTKEEERQYNNLIKKRENNMIELKAKLSVLKEWEKRDKEILEIIEYLKIKGNKNIYDKLSQEQISWNNALDKLKSEIKGEKC